MKVHWFCVVPCAFDEPKIRALRPYRIVGPETSAFGHGRQHAWTDLLVVLKGEHNSLPSRFAGVFDAIRTVA